jgi:hypothetical protein
MQPARIKLHAKEHTNNPVQRPNFRGHAAGDVEVTRACGKAPPPPKRTPRRPETKHSTPHRRGEPRGRHPLLEKGNTEGTPCLGCFVPGFRT